VALINSQLSIWELAHRWCGADPDDRTAIQRADVRDTLRKFAVETREILNLHNSRGEPDPDDFLAFWRKGESRSPLKDSIARCINERDYDVKVFDAAFVLKDEVEKWCRLNNFAVPAFWFREDELAYFEQTRSRSWGNQPAIDFRTEQPIVSTDALGRPIETASETSAEAVPIGKLRPSQRHRQAVRTVARELWKHQPYLNIVQIAEHEAIIRACDGKRYEEKTIREWIKDLDPRPAGKRGGRPKKKQ